MCSAEDAERGALERLAATVDDILFVLRMGPPLVVEYLSPSVGWLTGYGPEELVERPARILRAIHPHDRDRFRSFVERWLDADRRGQAQVRVQLRPATGEVRHVRIRTRPSSEPHGGPRRIVGIAAIVPGRSSDRGGSSDGEAFRLRELNHHLKNSMQLVSSLIYLQSTDARAEHERKALESARARVRSVGLLYETLLQEPDQAGIAMDRYLAHLVSPASHPLAAHRPDIRVDAEIERVVLDVDRAIACGLLVNELVANALKHAFPDEEGLIVIRLDQHEDTIELIVRDQGIGLPLVLPDEIPKLGLRLVHRLVAQLDGTLHVDRHRGTTVSIRFKARSPHPEG